ncbi:DUF4259 domain-containing protein [Xylanimonas sp. McL0601]|uniref:DUF4259 domain-containing protein n=1 Tax=Xylanimonas sp. McL0601 TaxID=3414739 RepID=UPI003CEBB4C5
MTAVLAMSSNVATRATVVVGKAGRGLFGGEPVRALSSRRSLESPVMGAWGIGPFENDGAADLVANIRQGRFTFENIMWAFEDPAYVDVDGGQIAVALGALVQATRGLAANPVPDLDLDAFSDQLTPARVEWVRTQIDRVTDGSLSSELYELWEEADELDQWLEIARAAAPASP